MLSLSPCGERFGEGKVPLLGKRGRGVVKEMVRGGCLFASFSAPEKVRIKSREGRVSW